MESRASDSVSPSGSFGEICPALPHSSSPSPSGALGSRGSLESLDSGHSSSVGHAPSTSSSDTREASPSPRPDTPTTPTPSGRAPTPTPVQTDSNGQEDGTPRSDSVSSGSVTSVITPRKSREELDATMVSLDALWSQDDQWIMIFDKLIKTTESSNALAEGGCASRPRRHTHCHSHPYKPSYQSLYNRRPGSLSANNSPYKSLNSGELM